MKSLKFLSLILMCATSSLGLLLPAVGVVKFPPPLANSAAEGAIPANLQAPSPNPATGISPTYTANGLPVSASANDAFLPPSLSGNSTLPNPTLPAPDHLSFFSPGAGGQKLGTGLWLLLVPFWFLSLLLWTIAPNPGVSKNR